MYTSSSFLKNVPSIPLQPRESGMSKEEMERYRKEEIEKLQNNLTKQISEMGSDLKKAAYYRRLYDQAKGVNQ